MASRVNILSQLTSIINAGVPQAAKVKNTQTDFASESAYPVIYILAGPEERIPRDTGNGTRGNLDMIVRVAAKGHSGSEDDVINPLIETITDLILANSTLNTTVLDAYVSNIETDQGTLYPFALAELTITTFYTE